ncbi:MAG: hypothetical protein A2309_00390 [Bacteroidetes bacterium RIFOXYB2_FULL_35_7]|nr:MAG: hypothetical protein A2X01_09670 [Bacteroidetes bacterium GWF2_35_48]OFY92992.1 MAG: hypothetical protein A2491_04815 [Bacteroidetes bacterium RIFOXYC12_FULL_35_7]OFY97169.1 MAG: hypothetical protein A2309_00390 [Bacteroidetes bacterium RIFOXYB2_FULL_35_7]HBX50190.1 hypothetical protein [Bacteroidales bacterium]
MKILQRIVIISGLIIIYCSSVCTLSNHKPLQGIIHSSISDKNQYFFVAFDFLENALQSEEINLIINLIPAQVLKDKTQEITKAFLFKDVFLINTESRYLSISKSLFYSLTHYDIIFPFHYFL